MKQGQRMVNYQGVEIALFPMAHLNVTQGRYTSFSHVGYNATDLAGSGTGIDTVFAPFTAIVVWKDPYTNTGVAITNKYKVQLANGKTIAPGDIFMMLWHDNHIDDLWVGQTIPQGKAFYQEGTAGWATGNHVHLELSYYRYTGAFPLYKLSNGFWTTLGTEINIEDAFYINDTYIVNTGGFAFKRYIPQKSIKELADEVIKGLWGVGADRVARLTDAGYDPVVVQKEINLRLAPKKLTITQVAREVIQGLWGVGEGRKTKLNRAGYDYEQVQAEVNKLLTPKKLTVTQVAKEVIQGLWGVGEDRKARLNKAGYNYDQVQAEVNKLLV